MTTPTVLVVGGDAADAGLAPVVVDLAHRTHTGVLNTWRAKGLFRFDDPAHLGTIGLQRDDLDLAGVRGASAGGRRIVLCGVGSGELPVGRSGAMASHAEVVTPDDLASLEVDDAGVWPPRPALYDGLAAVCGPRYAAVDVPLSPVRAAGDLAAWLPGGAVVTAGAGVVGFWLGRTFPTRSPGTVVLPSVADPGFTASVAASASGGVVVVCGPEDPLPEVRLPVGSRGRAGAGGAPRRWVVVERWLPDGPACTPAVRLANLEAAVAAGGHQVVEVAVAVDDLAPLEAVAGPVVVWGGPQANWSG